MHQQSGEQCRIGAGLQPQKQVGVFRRIGLARIDYHDPRAAPLFVGYHALKQNRMAPGGIGADQHQKIGLVEVFVDAGHGVGAERTTMAGHRGRHAQPRIRVDIGAADKALHQLVGNVIVFGQQLSGKIERDRIRAIARHDVGKAMRDMVERIGPGDLLHRAFAAADHGIEQSIFEAERFAERRTLRAQPAEIRRVRGIARDRCATTAVRRCQHAATDAAIGTGGGSCSQRGIDRGHRSQPIKQPPPVFQPGGRTSCLFGCRRSFPDCGSSRDTRVRLSYLRSAPRPPTGPPRSRASCRCRA